MKTLSIQTPEDIRQRMIEAFGRAIPTIQGLNSYPMIVVENQGSRVGTDLNIHWIWLLPNNEAITYGDQGKNQFIYIPKMATPVYAANINMSDGIEIVPLYGNAPPDELISILSVKKVRYKVDNINFDEIVVVVQKAKAPPAEVSQLYTKNYDCEYL